MYFVQSWKVYFWQVFFFTRSTTSSNCISVVPNYNIHSNNNLLLKYKLGKYFEHQTIQHLNDLLLLIFIIPSISITYFSSAIKFCILLSKKYWNHQNTENRFWQLPRYNVVYLVDDLICFIVLNVTFSNISVISWRPVLMVEEARILGKNHRPWASDWYALSLVGANRVHTFF